MQLIVTAISYRMNEYEEFDMRIMRLKEVMSNTGLGRSSIYKYIAEGQFPKPVPLTDRAVGWVDGEVDEWIMARIEQRDAGESVMN